MCDERRLFQNCEATFCVILVLQHRGMEKVPRLFQNRAINSLLDGIVRFRKMASAARPLAHSLINIPRL